jgi:flagellar biosynthesis protein FlhF
MDAKYQNVRTYRHETLDGALAALKSDLGSEAMIIHTKQIQKKGFLGFKGKDFFEIKACPEMKNSPQTLRKTNSIVSKAYQQPAFEAESQKMNVVPVGRPSMAHRQHLEIKKMEQDLHLVKEMLQEIVSRSREHDDLVGLGEDLQNLYRSLLDQGIRSSRAKSLIQELNHELTGEDLKNPKKLREALRLRLIERLPVTTPLTTAEGRPRVAAFIGPTGVGKTTTISKLAGYYHHYDQLNVALLSIDTYRIAATEQLNRVAEIIDVPIRSETSPTALARGIQDYGDKDLILIDTAGRSQRDTLQMNELKKYLEAAGADDIYLVLPTTQDVHSLEQVLENFGALATHLILSKLDESFRLGPLLDLVLRHELPVAYWTFGQSIPDDIAVVNRERLVKMFLGEESL